MSKPPNQAETMDSVGSPNQRSESGGSEIAATLVDPNRIACQGRKTGQTRT
jgi:hypothetical protein